MNSLTIKILPAGFLLLASACAPYPYYANTGFYGGGYSGGHKSYYGGAPDHYTPNYYPGRYGSHHRHNGDNGNRGWNNSWRQPYQSHGIRSHGGHRPEYKGDRGHHWH